MEKQLKKWLKQVKMNESAISMLLGVVVVLIVGVLLFNYFKNTRPANQLSEEPVVTTESGIEVQEKEGQLVPTNLPMAHKVVKGEHLWVIAEQYYGSGYNWVDIAQANGIVSPNQIEIGQELTIPQVAVKQATKVAELGTQITTAAETSIQTEKYTVVRGDDLWKIALRAYGDGYQWTKIFEANKPALTDPDEIEVGMELTLPR